ncbi:putative effector protein, partial [Blumeria hordei DH14]
KHGYICSDSGQTTNTFYDQALVEKSVTSACVPDSELSTAKLAANVEAKKYPQVWVDSKDYGFEETVLLWKYQGNSPESLEESNVFVFTNKSCDILGLLQKSGDQYTICKGVKKENDKKTSSEILSKKPRPGIFTGRRGYYENYEDDSPPRTGFLSGIIDWISGNQEPEQYQQRGYGGQQSMMCPPGGCPPNYPQMGCPPGGCPPNYPQMGCPPSGCPPNYPPMGCPPGGCPPNHPQMGCPPGGCPPNYPQMGCPPSGCPPNYPPMRYPSGGCGPGGCPPR